MFVSCSPIWDCEGSYLWIGEGDVVDIEDECKHVTRQELRCLTSVADRTLGKMVEHPLDSFTSERNIMAPDYDPYVTIAMWALLLLSLGMFYFYVPTIRCTSIIPARSEVEDKTDPEFDWDECRDTNFSLREWVRPYITLHNVLIVFHPLCVWFLAACVARSMQVGYWAPLLLAAFVTLLCAGSFSKNKPHASNYMTVIAALELLFIPFIWFRQQTILTQILLVLGSGFLVAIVLVVLRKIKR